MFQSLNLDEKIRLQKIMIQCLPSMEPQGTGIEIGLDFMMNHWYRCCAWKNKITLVTPGGKFYRYWPLPNYKQFDSTVFTLFELAVMYQCSKGPNTPKVINHSSQV